MVATKLFLDGIISKIKKHLNTMEITASVSKQKLNFVQAESQKCLLFCNKQDQKSIRYNLQTEKWLMQSYLLSSKKNQILNFPDRKHAHQSPLPNIKIPICT